MPRLGINNAPDVQNEKKAKYNNPLMGKGHLLSCPIYTDNNSWPIIEAIHNTHPANCDWPI